MLGTPPRDWIPPRSSGEKNRVPLEHPALTTLARVASLEYSLEYSLCYRPFQSQTRSLRLIMRPSSRSTVVVTVRQRCR